MASVDPTSVLNLSKHWPYRRGLFAVLILAVGVEIPIFALVGPNPTISLIGIGLTVVVVWCLWLSARALPRTRKNKVGFVISITCDDEAETKKIREDFILTLRRLVKEGKTGSSFQFIEVPNFLAEKVVDLDDAQKLRLKTRAHFLLYGRVRVREINKKEHHFIELDGLVAHKLIPDSISKQFSAEFSELLPRKVAIEKENDLLAFQFASEWAEIVAKYIIGIAAALSGDLVYAERLYRDALERITATNQEFPVFVKLQERIPIRISELHEAVVQNSYEKWVATHDAQYLGSMGDGLRRIDPDKYGRPSIFFLNAIYYFLHDKNVTRSRDFLNRCSKQHRDATWHFNMAFLHAYEGDLKTATRHYRNALKLPINPDLIAKIEDFLVFVAQSVEKEKYQLFYCLGFFNWHVKGDNLTAIKDFRKFLGTGDPKQFEKERELATKWVDELKKKN